MKQTNRIIDLSQLPEEAQKEMVDFYQFLKTKFRKSRKRKTDPLPDAFSKPLVVDGYMKVSREDIYAEI